MSKLNYDGAVALITGGSSGIGLGIAQALVERGARVALFATEPHRLEAAVARLIAAGGVAVGEVLDVRDRSGWSKAFESVQQQLGPVNILVLNAGAQGGRQRIEDTEPAEWDWVWSVNVDGLYNGLRTCLPAMRKGKAGHVLITASIASLLPRAMVTAYGASKAAALSLAEAVRLELCDSSIGISVLCPAGVRTSIADTMRRHAPSANDNTYAYMSKAVDGMLDPLDVGRTALDAMTAGEFYIFTHPELAPAALGRLALLEAALKK